MTERSELGRSLYELGLSLGRLGVVAIGSNGGSLAQALARAAGCGVALAGGEARFHDGSCAACGVWLGKYYALPATVFVRQRGDQVTVYALDGAGQPVGQLPEQAGEAGACTGEWDILVGADAAWAARRVSGRRRRGAVAVDGPPALALLLERQGYAVISRPGPGIPLFRSDEEGFRLTVELDGQCWQPQGEDALASAAVFVLPQRRAQLARPPAL